MRSWVHTIDRDVESTDFSHISSRIHSCIIYLRCTNREKRTWTMTRCQRDKTRVIGCRWSSPCNVHCNSTIARWVYNTLRARSDGRWLVICNLKKQSIAIMSLAQFHMYTNQCCRTQVQTRVQISWTRTQSQRPRTRTRIRTQTRRPKNRNHGPGPKRVWWSISHPSLIEIGAFSTELYMNWLVLRRHRTQSDPLVSLHVRGLDRKAGNMQVN